MRLNLLSLLGIITVLGAISSACQDHLLVQEPRFRLKSVVSQRAGYYSSTVYSYAGAGYLSSYVSRTGTDNAAETTAGQTTLMQYDAQGRLVGAEKQAAAATYPMTRFTYGYDGAGNIVSVKSYLDANRTGNYALLDEFTLTYGALKTPVSVTAVRGADQDVQQYTYTGENITRISQSGNRGANRYQNTQNGLTYDDKPNPFYKLVTAGPDVSLYSRNNLTDPGNVYDTRGLLIKRTIRDSGGNAALNLTETYEYEAF